MKKIQGVTLVALVVTIVILLILAGVTMSFITNDGIITKAQEATKTSNLASIKEQISLDILAAQMEKEGLTKEKLNEIVVKYGQMQEDGDKIVTEYGEISLKDILEGNDKIPEDNKDKITELEKRIQELEGTIGSLNAQLTEEKSSKQRLETEIADLEQELENKQTEADNLNTQLASKNEELEKKNEKIGQLENSVETLNNTIGTLNTQVADLTKKQSTGNATESQVLSGYTFSNSNNIGLSGTMPNRGTLNWSKNNALESLPAGYYLGGTIDSRPSYNAGMTNRST